ncbi:MAG: shikimate dehydrogenase [Actinomycetes bacterium]
MLIRCGVLGSPIAHSLSPVLHRAAYAELGLDWEYDAHEVTEDSLGAFLDGLGPQWRGLSLTMPLKRAVVPLLDERSELVEISGAANTVILQDGRRMGHNTDVPGAVAALTERHAGPWRSAIVLGGGATATSVLLALAELGCTHAGLVVRDAGRAQETLDAVARHPHAPALEVRTFAEELHDADVLVSTIPAGAQDDWVLSLALQVGAVFDVVYDPWPTPLAEGAGAGEVPLVSGLDLLVHQAVLQVELMTGRRPGVATLRAAGESALSER